MPIYLIIIIIIAVFILMGVQTILTRLKSPLWGAILPAGLVLAGIYSHFFTGLEFNYTNVTVFVVPLAWCLIECYRGRKRRRADAEKELSKMKVKDI